MEACRQACLISEAAGGLAAAPRPLHTHPDLPVQPSPPHMWLMFFVSQPRPIWTVWPLSTEHTPSPRIHHTPGPCPSVCMYLYTRLSHSSASAPFTDE